jgi:predicted permease
MIVLGIYLARTKISALFTTKRLYLVSTVRLLVIPLVTVLVFMLFPVSTPIRMTMLIAGAAPVGANVAVYSQLYDTDYGYACQTVTQSTLFSIVTMPVIIWVAERLF